MKKISKKLLSALVFSTVMWGVNMTMTQALPNNTIGSTPVKFVQQHQNLKIAGNLYLPKNYQQGKKYPAIITVHPGGGVKEQTSGLYAKKLAEKIFYDKLSKKLEGNEMKIFENAQLGDLKLKNWLIRSATWEN